MSADLLPAVKRGLSDATYSHYWTSRLISILPKRAAVPPAGAIVVATACLLVPILAVLADLLLFTPPITYLTSQTGNTDHTAPLLLSLSLVLLEITISLAIRQSETRSRNDRLAKYDPPPPLRARALIAAVLSIQLLAAGSQVAVLQGNTPALLILGMAAIAAIATHSIVLTLSGPSILTLVAALTTAITERKRQALEREQLDQSRALVDAYQAWQALTNQLEKEGGVSQHDLALDPLVADQIQAALGGHPQEATTPTTQPNPDPGPLDDNPYPQYDDDTL